MQFKAALILAFVASTASAMGKLSPDPSTLPEVDSSMNTTEASRDATWTVQAFSNGPELNMTGTVEQDALAKDANTSATVFNYAKGDGQKKLRKGVYCVEGSGVKQFDVGREIAYLRKVHGKPRLEAHTCDRVACSWYTGIHWCNDADHARSLPSFNNIADGAQVVKEECFPTVDKKYKGDLDHWDEWRVIVKDDDC